MEVPTFGPVVLRQDPKMDCPRKSREEIIITYLDWSESAAEQLQNWALRCSCGDLGLDSPGMQKEGQETGDEMAACLRLALVSFHYSPVCLTQDPRALLPLFR